MHLILTCLKAVNYAKLPSITIVFFKEMLSDFFPSLLKEWE